MCGGTILLKKNFLVRYVYAPKNNTRVYFYDGKAFKSLITIQNYIDDMINRDDNKLLNPFYSFNR